VTTPNEAREICPGCNYEWAVIEPDEVTPRINAAVGQLATILLANGESAARRPTPDRWSALEYGAHLRDVLLNVRDRLILTVIEDVPSPSPIYRDERVRLGLYADDSAATVATDLEGAARLFTSTFDVLRVDHLDRTLVYSKFLGEIRSLAWTGAQVLHECEHHLGDVRENLTMLG
jgi:hypothetical protein